MAIILGLDLGNFKSLACLYDTDTTEARFTTVQTDPLKGKHTHCTVEKVVPVA